MNNRQPRGRGRGRNNNNNNRNNNRGGGGIDRDNRIDNRARGNAAQMLEKFKKMANDAQINDDRVNAEYYLQFADHYFRVNADMHARREEQRLAREGSREEQRGGNSHDRSGSGDKDHGERQSSPPRGHQQSNNDDRAQNARNDDQSENTVEEKKPVRSRRPRKVADQAGGPADRQADDEPSESNGLDASALPPAISTGGDDEVKVVKKPARKKRVVKPKAVEAKAGEGDTA